jgi:hypothetical protein
LQCQVSLPLANELPWPLIPNMLHFQHLDIHFLLEYSAKASIDMSSKVYDAVHFAITTLRSEVFQYQGLTSLNNITLLHITITHPLPTVYNDG